LRIILADGEEENRIVFSDDGLVVTNTENEVTMNADGITLKDGNGNEVTQSSSGVTVDAGSNEVVLLGGTVKVGDAVIEKLIQGTTFMQNVQTFLISLATHTHVGNMGAPTSPPTTSFTLDVPLSNHLVE
jgi:co-chaperonin GroES (HSP10)